MEIVKKGIAERREATDVSLDAEREATDVVLEKVDGAVELLADNVLNLDRRRTDDAISSVRVDADAILQESDAAQPNRTIVVDRQAQAHERAVTDAAIEHERAQTDDALDAVRELRAKEEAVAERRDATDEHLYDESSRSTERSRCLPNVTRRCPRRPPSSPLAARPSRWWRTTYETRSASSP